VIHCLVERWENDEKKKRYEAVDLTGLDEKFVQLAGSMDHVCALTETGRIYSWGNNFAGKLGLGGFPFVQLPQDGGDWAVGHASPGQPFPTEPVKIKPEHRFTQVSVWANTSCALTDERENNAYCWGRVAPLGNRLERLDSFSQTTFSVPTALDLSAIPERRLAGITAGPAIGLGWTPNNEIYAWGEIPEGIVDVRFPLRLRPLMKFAGRGVIKRISFVRQNICVVSEEKSHGSFLYCSTTNWQPNPKIELHPIDLPTP
jgi:hypothetical protein